VVTAFDQVEFCMPVQWLACPVHEGSFSVESDRKDVRAFVATSLDFKLQRLAKEKDMNLYRYFAARYEYFAGLPQPT
ncbi:unnamed protein product, partial [Effrenium voratum]